MACLLVILFHAAPRGIFSGGFIGVDMFFVLSGYLITSLLIAERDKHARIAIGHFYLHRALRLVPALFLFLGAYLMIAPVIWPGESHLRDAGLAALYLSDYSYPLAGAPQYIRHSWSLSVEEQFYLLWPLLIPFIVQRKRGFILLSGAWVAVSIARYSLTNGDWINYYYPLHTHSSGLIIGALLALVQRDGWLKVRAGVGMVALIAFGALALTANITASALTITAAELLSCLIIGSIVSGTKSGISGLLASKQMVGLGKLSYGLYLWHFPIACYFRQDFGFVPAATATFGLALAGALFSYLTVEAWSRATKARLGGEGIAAVGGRFAPAASSDTR